MRKRFLGVATGMTCLSLLGLGVQTNSARAEPNLNNPDVATKNLDGDNDFLQRFEQQMKQHGPLSRCRCVHALKKAPTPEAAITDGWEAEVEKEPLGR